MTSRTISHKPNSTKRQSKPLQKSTNLRAIPADLLPHILSFLSLRHIIHFHFQILHFHELLKQNTHFWQEIFERETRRDSDAFRILHWKRDIDSVPQIDHRKHLIGLNHKRQVYRTLVESAISCSLSHRFRSLALPDAPSSELHKKVSKPPSLPLSNTLIASSGKLVLYVSPRSVQGEYNLQLYDMDQLTTLGSGLTYKPGGPITHAQLYRGKEEREWYAMIVSRNETALFWIGEYSLRSASGLSMRHVGRICVPLLDHGGESSSSESYPASSISAVAFQPCAALDPQVFIFVDTNGTLHIYNPFIVKGEQETAQITKKLPRYMQGTTAHRSRSFKIQAHAPMYSFHPPNALITSADWEQKCSISCILHHDTLYIAYSTQSHIHYCTLDSQDGLRLIRSQRFGSHVLCVRLSLDCSSSPSVKASILLHSRSILSDVESGETSVTRLMNLSHMISTLSGGFCYARQSFIEFQARSIDTVPALGYTQHRRWGSSSLAEDIQDVTLVFDAPNKSIWMITKSDGIDFVLCTSDNQQSIASFLKSAPMPHMDESLNLVGKRKVTNRICNTHWENMSVFYVVKSTIRTQERTTSKEIVKWSLNVYTLCV